MDTMNKARLKMNVKRWRTCAPSFIPSARSASPTRKFSVKSNNGCAPSLPLPFPSPRNTPNHRAVHLLVAVCLLGLVPALHAADSEPSGATPAPATASLEISLRTEGPIPETVHARTPFEWRIIVRWYNGGPGINPEIKKEPIFENLKILARSTTLRAGGEGGRLFHEKEFLYSLRPESEGEAVIGASAIAYRQPDSGPAGQEAYLTAPPLVLTVPPAPFSWSETLRNAARNPYVQYGGAFLIVAAAGAGVTIWRWRRSKRIEPQSQPVAAQDPAFAALDEAERFRVEGDRGRYVRMLEKAVRLALQNRRPDIEGGLSAFRGCLDEPEDTVLARFLDECEQIKFAPSVPSQDQMDRIMDEARRLVSHS